MTSGLQSPPTLTNYVSPKLMRFVFLNDDIEQGQAILRAARREFPALELAGISTAEAWARALDAGGFEGVMADGQLAWLDVNTLLRLVKARWPTCPIILLVPLEQEEIVVDALQAGLDAYLIKTPHYLRRLPTVLNWVIQQNGALRAAERRYQGLFDAVPVGLYRTTPDGQFLEVNLACVEILGYPSRAALLAVNSTTLYVRPEDRRHWHAAMERDGVVRNFVVELWRYTGGTLWVNENTRALPGEPGYYEGSIEDITDRKHIQDELHDSETRKAAILASALDAVVVADETCCIVEFNPAAEQMFGHTRAAIIGRELAEVLIPPDLRDQHRRGLAHYLATGEGPVLEKRIEVRGLRADGSEFPVELAIVVARLKGRPVFTAYLRDVTGRKRAEDELRAAGTRLRTLVEQLPAITYTVTYGTMMETTYISPQVHTLLGFTPAEWLADRELWIRQIHFADRDRVLRGVWKRDMEGIPFAMEYRVLTRSGQVRWFHNQNTVVRDDDGEPRYVYGVMFDITERKQREQELEAIVAVANALRAAASRAEMVPIILDQLLILLHAGGVTLASRDPATGETVIELANGGRTSLTGLRFPAGVGVWGKVIESGQPYVMDDASRASEGMRAEWLGDLPSVACVPLVIQAHMLGALEVAGHTPFSATEVRLLAAIADITVNALQRAALHEQTRDYAADLEQRVADRTAELRAANTHLQALSCLKDEFVSNLSHELRTPITSLKLYHDLLAARPEKRDDYLSRLKRETNRLERLVEDLLSLSRMDQGQVTPQMALVDLNALIALYVTDRQPMAESRGLTLAIQEEAHLPRVPADQAMLGKALSILLTNALTYTPAGGQVTVTTHRRATGRSELAGFSVSDTGPGIPLEEQPQLFQRFFRGTAGRNSGAPGTGLGLAIVREIVERHRGRVEAASAGAPGQGATFSVWLPLEAE